MSMKKTVLGLAAALVLLPLLPQGALAEEGATTPSANHKEWTITPRVWMVKNSWTAQNLASTSALSSSPEYPFYGATVRYGPSGLPKFDFLLSYFDGGGDYEIFDGGAKVRNARDDRQDVELLVRQKLDDSNFHILYGLRYITFDYYENDLTGLRRGEGTSETILGEVGVGFNKSMFQDSDKHNLFANLTVGYGTGKSDDKVFNAAGAQTSTPSSSSGVTAFDANVGYQYAITDSMAVHTRYRLFHTDDDKGGDANMSGPEIGLSYSF